MLAHRLLTRTIIAASVLVMSVSAQTARAEVEKRHSLWLVIVWDEGTNNPDHLVVSGPYKVDADNETQKKTLPKTTARPPGKSIPLYTGACHKSEHHYIAVPSYDFHFGSSSSVWADRNITQDGVVPPPPHESYEDVLINVPKGKGTMEIHAKKIKGTNITFAFHQITRDCDAKQSYVCPSPDGKLVCQFDEPEDALVEGSGLASCVAFEAAFDEATAAEQRVIRDDIDPTSCLPLDLSEDTTTEGEPTQATDQHAELEAAQPAGN